MAEHLTTDQIADLCAARYVGAEPAEEIARHLEACAACRLAVSESDALLDAAAAVAAEEAGRTGCPQPMELAAHAEGHSSPAVEAHLQRCPMCREVVQAAAHSQEAPATARVPQRRTMSGMVWRFMPGALAVAALIAVVLLPDVRLAQPGVGVRVGIYAGDVVRGEDDAVDEFDVTVTLDEPAVVSLIVLDRAGDLTVLAEQPVDDQFLFGRYGLWPPELGGIAEARRTHAIVLVSRDSVMEQLGQLDIPAIAPAQAGDACSLITMRLDCACTVGALVEP